MFDKQEFLNTLTQVGTCEDETQRRDLLATLNTEAAQLFDTNAELSKSNDAFKLDNETLRSANMKLFLQVGASKTPEQRKQDTTGINDKPDENLTYENLFKQSEGGNK